MLWLTALLGFIIGIAFVLAMQQLNKRKEKFTRTNHDNCRVDSLIYLKHKKAS